MSQSDRVIDQPPLSAQQRSELRSRAHPLKPVVMISSKGASAAVIAEIDRALNSHELIKIRVLEADRDERETLLGTVCEATGAQPVQHIGRILVIYRGAPKALPSASVTDESATRRGARDTARPARDTARRSRKPGDASRPARRKPAPARRFVSEARRSSQRRRPAR